jgi:phosphonate transport system substrate-binding protein
MCCALPCAAQNSGNKTYSLAIVPQYSPLELQQDWQPLLDRIKKETGIELQLKFSPNVPQFEKSFLRGEPDFAFANPYHSVMAKEAQDYIAIIRNQEKITGLLLVMKDSPVQELSDLKNKRIGFAAPNAFAASLLIRAYLSKERIPFETLYLKSHSNVYRNLQGGFVDAATGVSSTYQDEDPKLKEQFRILYQTPAFASHPIIVHPRVPIAIRTAITQCLLSIANDDEGRQLLKNIRLPYPTIPNYEQDYRPLKNLGIEKFLVND